MYMIFVNKYFFNYSKMLMVLLKFYLCNYDFKKIYDIFIVKYVKDNVVYVNVLIQIEENKYNLWNVI